MNYPLLHAINNLSGHSRALDDLMIFSGERVAEPVGLTTMITNRAMPAAPIATSVSP